MNGCKPGQPGEWKAKIEAGKCIRGTKLRMCKSRLRRRFIHGASRGCKVRVKRGVIVDQLLTCRVRGNPGTHENGNAEGQ